jgi:hypothetical protein
VIRAAVTLAAIAAAGVVAVALLEELDRVLRRDWPFALAALAIWLVLRNPFRGQI